MYVLLSKDNYSSTTPSIVNNRRHPRNPDNKQPPILLPKPNPDFFGNKGRSRNDRRGIHLWIAKDGRSAFR
jgi:hypothetical protein